MISNISVAQTGSLPNGGFAQASSEQHDVATSGDEHTERSEQADLTEAQHKQVRELKARDLEVRAHEQAHLSAAGGYAQGGPTFTYQRGPDGQNYAVGGEVQIDSSKVDGDPVATLRKAQVIRRAALAPANPSSQDRTVAAEASRMAAEAQAEITAQATSGDEEQGATDAVTKEDAGEVDRTGCPACGGAHASNAHEGMTAYAANQNGASQSLSSIV